MRIAKHLREGKDVDGAIDVDVLTGMAGVRSFIVVLEGRGKIWGVAASVLLTLLAVKQGERQLCEWRWGGDCAGYGWRIFVGGIGHKERGVARGCVCVCVWSTVMYRCVERCVWAW